MIDSDLIMESRLVPPTPTMMGVVDRVLQLMMELVGGISVVVRALPVLTTAVGVTAMIAVMIPS